MVAEILEIWNALESQDLQIFHNVYRSSLSQHRYYLLLSLALLKRLVIFESQ